MLNVPDMPSLEVLLILGAWVAVLFLALALVGSASDGDEIAAEALDRRPDVGSVLDRMGVEAEVLWSHDDERVF